MCWQAPSMRKYWHGQCYSINMVQRAVDGGMTTCLPRLASRRCTVLDIDISELWSASAAASSGVRLLQCAEHTLTVAYACSKEVSSIMHRHQAAQDHYCRRYESVLQAAITSSEWHAASACAHQSNGDPSYIYLCTSVHAVAAFAALVLCGINTIVHARMCVARELTFRKSTQAGHVSLCHHAADSDDPEAHLPHVI